MFYPHTTPLIQVNHYKLQDDRSKLIFNLFNGITVNITQCKSIKDNKVTDTIIT